MADDELGAAPQQDELNDPQQAQQAREAGALKLKRSMIKPSRELPSVSDDDSYEAIAAGATYRDPEGKTRVKPYRVQEDSDYDEVPEGAEYLDPEGKLRSKPAYRSLNYSAQTLYNMATNDREREKVLNTFYPGKIKRDFRDEVYVEDEGGVRRKPKGFQDAPMSYLSAAAAPVLGSIGGEIAGGVGGSMAAPGPGTFGGAVAGGAAGGALGEGFNSLVMQLAGVRDRDLGEEAAGMGLAAGMGGAGSLVGRTAGAVWPAIKNVGPAGVGKALGVDRAGLEQAIALREKGVDLVPPSSWAKGAPHLQNVAEVLHPAFDTSKPLTRAAEQHYERSVGDLLNDMGFRSEGEMLNPKAAVPTQQAGEKVIKRALSESTAADMDLEEKLAAAQVRLKAGGLLKEEEQQSLEAASEKARQTADQLIKLGFEDIDANVSNAMKVAKADSYAGDLWEGVGKKLRAKRTAFGLNAEKKYEQADILAGNHLPNTEGLSEAASAFLQEVPKEFESRYPSIIQKLRQFSGVQQLAQDEEGYLLQGAMTKPPVSATFGQLHQIRSMLRSGADWYTLSSDVKNGSFKYFAHKVDDILHDVNASPELKLAAKQLDKTDKWYAKNVAIFNSKELDAVMNGLKSGEPADPQNLFQALIRSGQSDQNAKIMKFIGPNLASGVRAADVQSMLDASKGLAQGQIDGRKFAREVLERHRNNMLHSVHGQEMGDKLLQQAQYIEALGGRFDVPVRPGDTSWDVIRRARMTADAAKNAGKDDPLKVLKDEVNANRQALRLNQRQRSKEPLGFLHNPTVGADAAVEKILGSEDLTLAAATKFGRDSPEFNALREVWVKNLLQGSMKPSAKLVNVSPEVQALMFPGATINEMQTLAKEMDFLLNTKALRGGTTAGAGPSMMATNRVEHPWGAIPGGKAVGKFIPGVDMAGRGMLEAYYKLVTGLANDIPKMKWILKGVKGDEFSRQAAREEMQRIIQRGGAIGAGVGASWQAPPHPIDPRAELGAEQSPDDGLWYMPPGYDPNNPDKYIRVDPK